MVLDTLTNAPYNLDTACSKMLFSTVSISVCGIYYYYTPCACDIGTGSTSNLGGMVVARWPLSR